jgi:hypothetical protein
MNTYGGVEVQLQAFLTSALHGGERSASRGPGRFRVPGTIKNWFLIIRQTINVFKRRRWCAVNLFNRYKQPSMNFNTTNFTTSQSNDKTHTSASRCQKHATCNVQGPLSFQAQCYKREIRSSNLIYAPYTSIALSPSEAGIQYLNTANHKI